MRTTRLAAPLLFAVAAAAAASAPFEGVADFRITTHMGQGQSLAGSGRMYLTARAYRSELEMKMGGAGANADSRRGSPGPVKVIMFSKLSEPDKITMVNEADRTYSVWDMARSREEWKKRPAETYTVKKLGSDTVAGLSCQNALLTSSKGDEIEACVSADFGASSDWIAAMNRSDRTAGSWIAALKGSGLEGFPLRWSTRSKGSKDATMTMELTHIEKKTLPASLFEPPAGYRQTETAMGGMTPAQQKAMEDALKNMTPEQRKAYEDAMKGHAPKPRS